MPKRPQRSWKRSSSTGTVWPMDGYRMVAEVGAAFTPAVTDSMRGFPSAAAAGPTAGPSGASKELIGRGMDTVLQDIKIGWRLLARRPGFAAMAIVTLALGIGGNTAVFTVVNTVLLRPLPYPDSEGLLRVSELRPFGRGPMMSILTNETYHAWRERTRTIESLAAYAPRAYTLTGAGDARRLAGAWPVVHGGGREAGRESARHLELPGLGRPVRQRSPRGRPHDHPRRPWARGRRRHAGGVLLPRPRGRDLDAAFRPPSQPRTRAERLRVLGPGASQAGSGPRAGASGRSDGRQGPVRGCAAGPHALRPGPHARPASDPVEGRDDPRGAARVAGAGGGDRAGAPGRNRQPGEPAPGTRRRAA